MAATCSSKIARIFCKHDLVYRVEIELASERGSESDNNHVTEHKQAIDVNQ